MRWTIPLLCLAGIASCSFPVPEPCYGDCSAPRYADASVIIRDGIYYRFSKANSSGMGIELATAPSLRGNWTYKKDTILPGVAGPNTHLWAPEVHYIKGLYYLYYGIFGPAGFDIAVATSETLAIGSFKNHGPIGVPEYPKGKTRRIWTRLGQTLLVSALDPSGEAIYPHMLAFGSYQSGIYGIRMANPPLKVAADAQPFELIADEPIPVNMMNSKMNRTEGPYWYKRNATEYFVFYSRGSNSPSLGAAPGDVYRVQVCRASNPTGPYMDKQNRTCTSVVEKYGPDQPGTTVLASHDNNTVFAPGSVGILDDPVEGTVMYYQYYNGTDKASKKLGKTFGFNYLEFTADGWPKLVQNRPTTG